LGDAALTIQIGDQMDRETFLRVRALADFLEANPFPGLQEYVPAMASVTLYYDVGQLSWREAELAAERVYRAAKSTAVPPARRVEIPVCYGGEFGEDLEFVASHHRLTAREVIRIHADAEYLVHMIGFVPGFPYLGGMSQQIATPRRSSPRLKIPAGSVGIAGSQTGIYPLETPGGWQLIGRTPLALFRPANDPPALLRAGDTVLFRPIDPAEFAALATEPICPSA
jgi:inhibitor of KinA